ncbi:MAG TPA: chromate resistance protein ChrB domain-containing protein [Paucimonas sp.]|nr:chromate resistance protein ChrB domain-containing protein [Paucimonas sp.]
MENPTDIWLLLIVSLPSINATARIRIWRALKASGCTALRDGAYLLPDGGARRHLLEELAEETRREGGSAWLLTVAAQTMDEERAYRQLFDRNGEYGELLKALSEARSTLTALTTQELSRLVRKLRREYEALRAIDFFPNEASAQAEASWRDFLHVAEAIQSPGEPRPADAVVVRRDIAAYRGRLWATRKQLWVDRVASAWLIRRFIDSEARFLWLDSPADCPAGALGFDFDGAAFTHVGELVTFEVLLASFGLDRDPGLARIAAMVHALDVGGAPVPEAAGFEALLAGARQRLADDDRLLVEVGAALDSLHAYFSALPAEGRS